MLAAHLVHRGLHQEGAVRALHTLRLRRRHLRLRGRRDQEARPADQLRRHPGPRRVPRGEDRRDILRDEQVRHSRQGPHPDQQLRQQGEAAQGALVRQDDNQRPDTPRLRRHRRLPPKVDVPGDDAFSGQI